MFESRIITMRSRPAELATPPSSMLFHSASPSNRMDPFTRNELERENGRK